MDEFKRKNKDQKEISEKEVMVSNKENDVQIDNLNQKLEVKLIVLN